MAVIRVTAAIAVVLVLCVSASTVLAGTQSQFPQVLGFGAPFNPSLLVLEGDTAYPGDALPANGGHDYTQVFAATITPAGAPASNVSGGAVTIGLFGGFVPQLGDRFDLFMSIPLPGLGMPDPNRFVGWFPSLTLPGVMNPSVWHWEVDGVPILSPPVGEWSSAPLCPDRRMPPAC